MIARQAAPMLDPDLEVRYLVLIERRLGLRLSAQQALALPAAVAASLRKSGLATAADLYAMLAASDDSTLMDMLGADLTIGETHFFRIAPQIEALRAIVLPEIMARRSATRRLGIWSAGCSTGEETYTLAMLAHEALPATERWEARILGTDLSHRALATAREALYGEWSFRETPGSARARYFTAEGRRWRLAESIKRMVHFSHLNLMADVFPTPDPASPGLDLILCRNVTIYFSPEACTRLYRRLAEALAPGGWLVLGPSDPTPDHPALLEPMPVAGAILWRRKAPVGSAGTPAPAIEPFTSEYRPIVPALAGRRVRPHAAATNPSTVRAGPALQGPGDARSNPVPNIPAPDFEAHLLLGLRHLDAGAVDEAIAGLRRAAFLNAEHSLTQFSLGKAYLHAGDASRARAAFSHARRLLAAAPADQPVEVGGEMTAEELRFAVEAHLAALSGMGER
jgi:chemotaxis protein methyltransferase CheR